MPHRKPPKRLSTSCTAVISNTVLDVIVKVEQTIVKDSSNKITEATNEQSGCCSGVKDSSDRKQKYDDMELEIAKYILSNIPNALISLVFLEIMSVMLRCRYVVMFNYYHNVTVSLAIQLSARYVSIIPQ